MSNLLPKMAEKPTNPYSYDWYQIGHDDVEKRRHNKKRGRNIADRLEHLMVVIRGVYVWEGGGDKLVDERKRNVCKRLVVTSFFCSVNCFVCISIVSLSVVVHKPHKFTLP